MTGVDEVAAAEVHTNVHVGWAGGDAGVVEGYVGVERFFHRVRVQGVGVPAGDHLFGTEV